MTADWGDDVLETATPPPLDSEPYLTPRQVQLRDGTAQPSPTAGLARQQRMSQMQADMAACNDLATEMDRIAEHLAANPLPCVNDLAPKLVKAFIAKTRSQAVTKGRQLRDELAYLQEITP